MATVTVHFFRDALHLTDVESRTVKCNGTVRDAVGQAFPELHPARMVYVVGTHPAHGDARVRDGDIIRVTYRPAGVDPLSWAAILTYVIGALVGAAVSYLVGYLMRPKQRNKFSSPAYSVNIEQNAARLGGTVPVIYGRVLALPDIASQPYSEFVSNNERVSMILNLGMGEFIINDIFVGESRISDYPAGSIVATLLGPDAHQQMLGNIEAYTGVMEDVFTVPESTGVELGAPNDPSELSVSGTASGGVLRPNDPTAATYWIGLVPGQKYVVTTSAGGRAVLTYVGVGPDGSAQFDGPLPPAPVPVTFSAVANLIAAQDAKEGDVMKMVFNNVNDAARVQHQFTVRYQNLTRGPYQIYKTTGIPEDVAPGLFLVDDPKDKPPQGPPTLWLRTHGSGYTSANNTPIDPAVNLSITSTAETIYYLTPYYEGSTPTVADPYRWRGWFALCRPGDRIDALWFDLEMPGGLAWITDKGDYNPIQVNWLIQIQLIDDESAPIGPVIEHVPGIAGATSQPLRRTWGFELPIGRYRARVARVNPRDQRASKEISGSRMAGLRARIYHPYGTPAYEACTLLVMRFTATAGLSAAAGRRIKVDCTRKLPDVSTGALLATSNPAEAFCDILENTDYGAARPATETDRAQVLKLRAQWDTVNGFNGVFDQPITVVDALQAVLGPVRAMPLPIGAYMSVAQDAPRTRDYIFGPDTIVQDSLTIGYNFDGTDEPDHLEVIYTDPDSMADARVYYPSKGLRPETVEIFGCTSAAHATAWAKLTWQEKQLNRKTVQLELEGEGYLIQPLTRFGVAIPNVNIKMGAGLGYGPELVTNGTFDVLTPWVQQSGTVTATGGLLRCMRAGGSLGRGRYTLSGLLVGQDYELVFTRVASTGTGAQTASITISATSATGSIAQQIGGIGTYRLPFTATLTTHWVMLDSGTGVNGNYTDYDNVSVKAVIVSNPTGSSGGAVLRWDAAAKDVYLDTPFPPGVATIYFKSDTTGKILGPSYIAARISDYQLRLFEVPTEVPHGSDATGDATRWVATGSDLTFFEFSVTDMESTGPMRVKVTGNQYTTEKYTGTFVQNWIT
jgi:hypothetical protein